tara:strand:- start:408 stop:668 length:261 start_codon:yes stop_codon:yes gene_type:complete
MKNHAELELQLIRLEKLKRSLTKQEIEEERKGNNIIKIGLIRKKWIEVQREVREIEKIIFNDEEIPDRIYRFGRWYIAEQEVRNEN